MNNINLIPTTGMDYAAWLKARNAGIGGSEVAALIGVSKWQTPLSIYERKIGEAEDDEPSVIMQIGTALEDLVRDLYQARTGLVAAKPQCMFVDEDNHMLANVDGIITAEQSILECKTVRSWKDWGEDGTQDIPDYYMTQVQHYMAVLDVQTADVAALNVVSGELRIYPIKRSDVIVNALRKACKEFWENHVVPRCPPAPVTLAEVQRSIPATGSGEAQAGAEDVQNVRRMIEVQAAIKALKEEEDGLKAALLKTMDGAAKLVYEGTALCAQSVVKGRATFDSAAFKKDHADLYDQYVKTGAATTRFSLKVKEI